MNLLQNQRLVSYGTLVDFPYSFYVDCICLFLEASVVKPEIVVISVKCQLFDKGYPSFAQHYVLHVFSRAELLLKVNIEIMYSLLFI